MNDFGLTEKHREILTDFFRGVPEIDEVYIYGSRARGDYRPTSDIDFAVRFIADSDGRAARVESELSELPIIYKMDVVDMNKIGDDFREDVERDKQLFYRRKTD